MSRGLALVSAVVAVGVLAGGAAVAWPQDQPTLTIDSTKVKAKWRESWLGKKGRVTFSATVSAPAQLQVTLRGKQTHQLVSKPLEFSVEAGTFTKQLRLFQRPLPGPQLLRITGTSGDANLPPAEVTVNLPSPPEGVIDRAYMSKTKRGGRVKVIRRGAHIIYAHFHFIARPRTNKVHFIWKRPGNPKIRFIGRATKKYHENMTTFVKAQRLPHGYAKLRKGHWYCIVSAAGRVAKRQVVIVR